MVPGQGPNKRLRLQRRLRGWSQEDVAAGLHRLAASLDEPELGVDAAMVGRWERGTRRPRPRYVRLLSALFELPAEQLGVVDDPAVDVLTLPSPHQEERDDLERRDFIQTVSTLLGVAALPPSFTPLGTEPWERLERALSQPGRVDADTVDHLEQVTMALQSLGPTQVSSRALLGPVTGHLDAVTLLLRGSLPTALRRQLVSIAADTAGFAGWLRWNMGEFDGAMDYFRTGLLAAREAGDRALGAYLAGSAACQPPYREDPAERVRQLQGRSQGFARGDATPATQVWLAAKEADAHALLGAEGECLRQLDRAATILNRVDGAGRERRPRFTPVTGDWLAGERGASLAKLGRTDEARTLLLPVLASLAATGEHDRLWLLTSLAATYVRDGEPEEASRLARIALVGAAALRLEPVLATVRGLRRDLEGYAGSPAVRAFDEELLAVAGAGQQLPARAEPA